MKKTLIYQLLIQVFFEIIRFISENDFLELITLINI